MKKIPTWITAIGHWFLLFVQLRFFHNDIVDNTFINESLVLPKGMKRMTLDNKYWVCSKETFMKLVKWVWVSKMKYVGDRYDCDNFAFTFKALVGLIWGLNNVGVVIDTTGGHAYNIIIFDDGSWELFEPQSGRFVKPGEHKMYTFKRGQVIL